MVDFIASDRRFAVHLARVPREHWHSNPIPVDDAPTRMAGGVLEAVPERAPDDAYIETERCSSYNECTTINNRTFAYNGNKQAYIADLTVGTCAQLVETAESCQVSVIHPGRPINQNEPGLEDLPRRAAPFL